MPSLNRWSVVEIVSSIAYPDGKRTVALITSLPLPDGRWKLRKFAPSLHARVVPGPQGWLSAKRLPREATLTTE